MKPSKKSDGMELTHKAIFGFDRQAVIESDKCVPAPYGCGGDAKEFRNEISKREYSISGMCQKCQDNFFGVD